MKARSHVALSLWKIKIVVNEGFYNKRDNDMYTG